MDNFPVKICASRDSKDKRIVFLSVEAELMPGDDEREKKMKVSRIFGMLNLIAINLNATILNTNKEELFPRSFDKEIRFINWLNFSSLDNSQRFLDIIKKTQ